MYTVQWKLIQGGVFERNFPTKEQAMAEKVLWLQSALKGESIIILQNDKAVG